MSCSSTTRHRRPEKAGKLLVRAGADGSPPWTRVRPTPEENPRHAGPGLWMTVNGYRIVSRPASASGWPEDADGS